VELVGDLAQWQSACLASARPWVRSPAPKKKKKKEWKSGVCPGNVIACRYKIFKGLTN